MTVAVALLAVAVAWAASATAARRAATAAVRRRLGGPGPAPPLDVQPVLLAAGVLAAGAVAPLVGAAALAVVAARPWLHRRRRARLELAVAVATLPDTIDLLGVAARAGLPAPAAVGAVAQRAPPPWGVALAAVDRRAGRGERFADAVAELTTVGPAGHDIGHPLRALLRAAVDDGADLAGGLDRLAADARDLRRRRAQEAARRVPIRLLLPLVACSLPAFALLTIVPIVAGAVQALDL